MCGRTTLTITADDLERTFGYTVPLDYRPSYNIAPTQPMLSIARNGAQRGFRQFRWGLIPSWAKDPSIGNRMINARADTLATKPAYREAFARRRCLVVVDGFYEWMVTAEGNRPHRICRLDGEAFTIAGVWERWRNGETLLETCAIVTTDANRTMSAIHDRMPVIVEPDAREKWLSPETERAELEEILRPHESDDLQFYEVSTLVNSPANDVPECVDPLGSERSVPEVGTMETQYRLI